MRGRILGLTTTIPVCHPERSEPSRTRRRWCLRQRSRKIRESPVCRLRGFAAIGSGGMYALAAAKMLKKYSNLSAKEIVEEALKVASEICIYTNDKITVEVIAK